ncbi:MULTISPECIES: ComEA family DNA-binding protein [Mannheimia]|uniref:Helix-hairpin-helix domain-containing protein n=1 Tax=Mannheimia pernigra TaxID=111844 RepID=A0A7H8UWF0_9PAST|nr:MULTISPECIES: helix-hairpin-helix domain-containing protein [Mannheimia]QHB17183.1 transporter [Mannheimia pernigra]QLB40054.1 helix-hairpin-helix domain-containing protein [Mannheimia pernigra]QLB43601.1 helix-hairpin-helix domain-containing protein [Mannheimia pernigra]QTM00767.1 transporter [Mannheimia sp. ZY171111]
MNKMKTLALSLLIGLNTLAFAQKTPQIEQNNTLKAQQSMQKNLSAVNINTASAAELQDKLVGIGEKKAQAIVDYRTQNGNFKSIEQLTEVSGIGQATLEKNRGNIILE